ncbi:hypothetical protein IKF67_00655 [Candidatus Saccharibacteria bacterium]|nr:hypothetical protein [Candidatus Saccharibacteria bacterium]
MAEESKNNKGLITGICAAVVVVIIIIVAIVLGARGGGLNDSYFVSDGSKYVLNLDADDMSFDDEEYAPVKTHLVYTYEGDKVTSLKAYYEYENAEDAQAAYNYIKETQADAYKSISIDGKYVILEANEEDYADTTPDDVKQQIEFMEALKDLDLTDDEDETETEDEEEVEETDEEGEEEDTSEEEEE